MSRPTEGERHRADPAALATTYAAAWQEHDWPRLRSILADDVTFRGPLGRADSAGSASPVFARWRARSTTSRYGRG